MKLLRFISLCLVVVGCAPVANTNRYGPSESFVDLRPYAANGPFKNFDSPSSLVKAIEVIGGPQKDLETNSDFKKRIEKLGAFSVLSDVKDFNVKFDRETGAFTYEKNMEEAQSWGFSPNGELLSDRNNFYYSLDLPEDKYHKSDYVGQNSFGAKDAPINLSCSRGKLQFSRHLQRHWTKSDRKIMYGELFRPVLRVKREPHPYP